MTNLVQDAKFEEILENELEQNLNELGISKMNLTNGFIPSFEEQELDEKEIFEEFCLSNCLQNQFLHLEG